MIHPPQLYTTEQAAELLGLKKRKIWSLAAGGRLGHHRIDQQLRFTAEQLSAFLTDTLVPPRNPQRLGPTFGRSDLPPQLQSLRAAEGSRRRSVTRQRPSSSA